MTSHIGTTFTQTRVKLDDNEFRNCVFERCALEFSGTGPVTFHGCNFNDVDWVMTGAAQNTLKFLGGMYHGMGPGGRSVVEATFEQIRKP